jgi:hypothetical protein
VGCHEASGISAAIYSDDEARALGSFCAYAGHCRSREVTLTRIAEGTIEQLLKIAYEAGY